MAKKVLPMPLLRINSGPLHPAPADGRALIPALDRALAALQPGDPIVVLLHGLRFSPFISAHDPHGHIFGMDPQPHCQKALSWPVALGYDGTSQGLCIPFAWDGALKLGEGYRRAGQAGRQLAGLLTQIAALSPNPVHLFAHSLGARVALRALALTHAPVARAVLLNPAEFHIPAAQALSSPVGQRAEILHVSASENLAFDALFQLAAPRRRRTDIALGLRIPKAPNWHRLAISQTTTRARLATLGYPITAPTARLCHWSTYTRPGMFALYRALLCTPNPLPLSLLAPPGFSVPGKLPPEAPNPTACTAARH